MKIERGYPTYTVTPKAENAIVKGHPWVYDAEILNIEGETANGGLVDVISKKGRYLGTGFLSQQSKIRVRLISRNANDRFDEDFWRRRIEYAWAYRKAIYPVVVASQTIPTTAIAPLFVLWFGYGIWSKVLVTVLITFFPITITVYDGLQSARVEMMELLLTYGATKRDIFCKIKVPCTLPYFFSAIKMAIPMSIIGAAIGEWLGAQSGLGYFSRRMMTQLDGAGVFAPIVLLSAVAMAAVALVALLEKKVVRWRGEF